MNKIIEWSNLPEELVDLIANHLFSNVELLRVRSICKSWRSAIAINKSFPNHRKRNRKRTLASVNGRSRFLSPATFCRVILSSCPNRGWLIKTQDDSNFCKKHLFCPLSRFSIYSSDKSLDLLNFTVSEIHQSYAIQSLDAYENGKVVLVDDLVFKVNHLKQIWWCNSEETSNHVWTRILDEETENFIDIILHKGQIYALDLNGAIWWISLSELKIYQYGPSTPMDYYEVDYCKDRRLIEYCGDLCVVHRFCKRIDVKNTICFKVYKMDEELVEWVEVKSLGDEAFVMATDCCFSVLARDYYGCLENSIYFTDEKDKNCVNVFKLSDCSITKLVNSSSQSCFQMFYPPFV